MQIGSYVHTVVCVVDGNKFMKIYAKTYAVVKTNIHKTGLAQC